MLNHQLVLLAKDPLRGALDLVREPLVRRLKGAELVVQVLVVVALGVGVLRVATGTHTPIVVVVLQLLLQAPDVLHEQNCEGGKGTFA